MVRAGLSTASVVHAAATLVDAEGFEALTLARLAAALGVRTPSLYAHVGGLADLRARLADRGAAALAAEISRASVGRAGSEALQALADAYRGYAHAHPGLYAALQRPARGDADLPGAAAAVETVLAVLRGYDLEGETLIHGARIVRSALHGFVELELNDGFGMDVSVTDSWVRLIRVLDGGLTSLG